MPKCAKVVLEGAAKQLIHDTPLREAVDHWLVTMDEAVFTFSLPLFRRVFAALDRSERRLLLDAVLFPGGAGAKGYRLIPGAAELWPRHQARAIELLKMGADR